jgi:hypothetical protein
MNKMKFREMATRHPELREVLEDFFAYLPLAKEAYLHYHIDYVAFRPFRRLDLRATNVMNVSASKDETGFFPTWNAVTYRVFYSVNGENFWRSAWLPSEAPTLQRAFKHVVSWFETHKEFLHELQWHWVVKVSSQGDARGLDRTQVEIFDIPRNFNPDKQYESWLDDDQEHVHIFTWCKDGEPVIKLRVHDNLHELRFSLLNEWKNLVITTLDTFYLGELPAIWREIANPDETYAQILLAFGLGQNSKWEELVKKLGTALELAGLEPQDDD